MKNLKMMLKFWLKLESARKNVEVSRSHICPTQAQGQGQKRKECFAPCGRDPGTPHNTAHMRQHGKFEYLKLKNWCQTPFPNDFLENLIPSFLDGFGDVLRFSDMFSCPGTVPDHSGMDSK